MLSSLADLSGHLPRQTSRMRMVSIPIIVSLMHDDLDMRLREAAPSRGSSINGIAGSLDIPFETARRVVRRLIAAGWLVFSPTNAVMVGECPAALAWRATLADRVRSAGGDIDRTKIAPDHPIGQIACDLAAQMVMLDLLHLIAGLVRNFGYGYAEIFFLQYVCALSVRRLATDPGLAARLSFRENMLPDEYRDFIPIPRIANDLHMARSTIYRLVRECLDGGAIERDGNAIRPTAIFLASDAYAHSMDLIASRTATLMARAERHVCAQGCGVPPAAPMALRA
ncbi:hypothetical protein [Sphingomonas sp.]|uniref:hypothetical protein n=1 Tax=Sphingomonas sp. TaxID=28214 RepID=UPI001EC4705F|nr:hypothetical protein [Sphingomonas sp.]MBX3593098.1 hypothetical protein [Sphingomonas sp.]